MIDRGKSKDRKESKDKVNVRITVTGGSRSKSK